METNESSTATRTKWKHLQRASNAIVATTTTTRKTQTMNHDENMERSARRIRRGAEIAGMGNTTTEEIREGPTV